MWHLCILQTTHHPPHSMRHSCITHCSQRIYFICHLKWCSFIYVTDWEGMPNEKCNYGSFLVAILLAAVNKSCHNSSFSFWYCTSSDVDSCPAKCEMKLRFNVSPHHKLDRNISLLAAFCDRFSICISFCSNFVFLLAYVEKDNAYQGHHQNAILFIALAILCPFAVINFIHFKSQRNNKYILHLHIKLIAPTGIIMKDFGADGPSLMRIVFCTNIYVSWNSNIYTKHAVKTNKCHHHQNETLAIILMFIFAAT